MASRKLCFNASGKFKIMQLADIQENPDLSPDTIRLIEGALEREKPDLVVLTGDQIKGYSRKYRGKHAATESAIRNILGLITRRDIPIAVTYGNHDRQSGVSNARQADFYRKYGICAQAESEFAPGTGCIPIFDQSGKTPLFALYIIDSNGGKKGGGYEPVSRAQIDYYRGMRDALAARYGLLPSLVFLHIPLPEYYNVLKRVDKGTPGAIRAFRTHKNEFYALENMREGEFFKEPPSSPDENTGAFAAFAEKGDVLGVYCGHDHNNCFVRPYAGIDLGYTPGCGFHVYGPGLRRAVRVFTIDAKEPGAYQTHTLDYRDLGGRLHAPVKDFVYRHVPTTREAAIREFIQVMLAAAGGALLIALIAALL